MRVDMADPRIARLAAKYRAAFAAGDFKRAYDIATIEIWREWTWKGSTCARQAEYGQRSQYAWAYCDGQRRAWLAIADKLADRFRDPGADVFIF